MDQIGPFLNNNWQLISLVGYAGLNILQALTPNSSKLTGIAKGLAWMLEHVTWVASKGCTTGEPLGKLKLPWQDIKPPMEVEKTNIRRPPASGQIGGY
jgi:hypothetical protein